MTNSQRLPMLVLPLMIAACTTSRTPISQIPTPSATSPTSSSAINPLCHSLTIGHPSVNDTKATVAWFSADTIVKKAGCPNLK